MMHPKAVKAAKAGSILISLLLCGLGILMLVYPKASVTVLTRVIGVLLICYGVIKLTGYFSKDLFRLAFQFDLAFGLLLIAAGILMLVRPQRMVTLLGFLIGILVLTDGLFKIQTALDARRFGLRAWWLILTFAILSAVAGLLLMCDPLFGADLLMLFAGICLIAEGVLNLCVVISAVKITKQKDKDSIDVEYYIHTDEN